MPGVAAPPVAATTTTPATVAAIMPAISPIVLLASENSSARWEKRWFSADNVASSTIVICRGLRSRSGSLTVGSLVAGDDIVLRGALGVTAISLKAGALEHLGVGDQLFAADPSMLGGEFSLLGGTVDVRAGGGAVSIGSAESTGDVRLQTLGGAVNISGLVTAGRDILADGASVNARAVSS